MQVQANTLVARLSYQSIFASEKKDSENEDTNNKSINATQMKARQSQGHQSNAVKRLSKQIQKLQESIEKTKLDEKLSAKEKTDQLQAMQKEMQELQKQMAEVTQKEKETKIKEQQEKRANEEAKHLSPEENEKKAQEAQQRTLTNLAVASKHLEAAVPFYYKVKEFRTKGQLGMGSKYNGNLSAEAVDGLFIKAAKYGKLMASELGDVKRLVKSALKASEEYKKHEKAAVESEEKEDSTINTAEEEKRVKSYLRKPRDSYRHPKLF